MGWDSYTSLEIPLADDKVDPTKECVEKGDILEIVEPMPTMVSKMTNKNIIWSDVVQDSIVQGVHTDSQ